MSSLVAGPLKRSRHIWGRKARASGKDLWLYFDARLREIATSNPMHKALFRHDIHAHLDDTRKKATRSKKSKTVSSIAAWTCRAAGAI